MQRIDFFWTKCQISSSLEKDSLYGKKIDTMMKTPTLKFQ